MMTIKVMVVDDSAVMRKVLTDIIEKDPALELMAAVADPIFAMKRLEKGWPDVMILDVEMPRMDGITFLRKLMSEHPIPVVICSTLTEAGAETTMQAMSSGAVDIVTKPKIGAKSFFQEEHARFLDVIKSASHANVGKIVNTVPARKQVVSKFTADVILSPAKEAMTQTTERVVAIGTSTGGTRALESVLIELPRTSAGIVVVQHMPEKFTAAFAARLDSVCELTVKEAKDGDRVLSGEVLIAPGGYHMLLRRSGAKYYVEVKDGPLVSRHKPSVDVLFRSVAKAAGSNALGIIMTGMGDDGAHGMKEMHDFGARTIAQDESSCVVYGMPKEAVKLNAVDHELPLDQIPLAVIKYSNQN
ncbi:MAG: chemotaxis response regulator protein-glutamate methylesterase [Gammaproteobacteria bacterium]|nr:chemotaxis response regulator protein-glutamate methylesterase [Gammaproteobacteria bacterium]